jgi:fumarylacetoacetase
MIAHHTLSGCALHAGDVLGSGTISGPAAGACGALLESTKDGNERLSLGDGITRGYLEDGDEVVLRGFAGYGESRVGFGDCFGVILSALV